MSDAIEVFQRAMETNDIDSLIAVLAPDVELVAPVSGRMVFRGRDDVGKALTVVYGMLSGSRLVQPIGDGDRRVLYGETRFLGFRMTDAAVVDLAPDGSIRRIAPHLRPWLPLTLFALLIGPKLGRHPGMMRRALAG
jgi:hypothetical protein